MYTNCFPFYSLETRKIHEEYLYIWNIHVFDQVQSISTYSRVIRLFLKKWSFSMSTVYNFMLLYVHNANTDSFMYKLTVRLTRCSPFLLIRVLATYSWKNWIFSYQTRIISSYCVCMLLIKIVYVISPQLYVILIMTNCGFKGGNNRQRNSTFQISISLGSDDLLNL